MRFALLNPGHLDGVGAFFAFFEVEFHPVAFLDFVDEAGLVNEDFLLVIIGDDKAETFGIVVEFNGTGEHSGGEEVVVMKRGYLPTVRPGRAAARRNN